MHGRLGRSKSMLLAVVLVGLAAAVPPAAADPNDGRLGGPPESAPVFDSTTCPAGTLMNGATGVTRLISVSTVVAVATADCLGPEGQVTAPTTMGTLNPAGGDTPGSTSCPAGQIAVGIEGLEGDFVDQLVLRCRPPDLSGAITPSSPAFGGNGGGADGPYDCPAGQALSGLTGEVVFSPSMIRYVQITCAAVSTPTTPTTPTTPPTTTVPPPVLGKLFNVQRLKGTVLIAIPTGATAAGPAGASQKGLRFVPLEQVRQIPVGSFLDTRRGTVRLTTARNSAGTTQSGDFSAGLFQVLQSSRSRARGLTDVVLKGSSFRRCRSGRASDVEAAARRRRVIRRLRANARGRFRTRGRYSAATVRGTKWSVTDRCDGTLTKVTRGSVVVRDFRLRRRVVVRAGKRTRGGGRGSYLARAR